MHGMGLCSPLPTFCSCCLARWVMAVNPDIAIAVSVWVEDPSYMILTGVYACLFFFAFYIMLKKQNSGMSSAKVFLCGTLAMFLVATGDLVVNLYRFLRAFVLHVDPLGPTSYFFDFTRWDALAHNAMLCIMTWLGDALVIYRCYVIWDRKLWVTYKSVLHFPVFDLLLLNHTGSNAALFFWFTHPNVESPSGIAHWLGRSILRIRAKHDHDRDDRHRHSVDSGLVHVSPLNLLAIMRIIIESAMIYTLQLLVLIVLFPLQEFAQLIVQNTVIPSIGIIFVLIAVRVHFSRSRTLFGPAGLPTIHPWLSEIAGISSTASENNTQEERNRNSEGSLILEMGPVDNAAEKKEGVCHQCKIKLALSRAGLAGPRLGGQTVSAP
ncbi:hypothetical protein BJ912DRAFT_974096 [Pholiota molesta]|nr:hypothetical protein BJ912DRAFT_974096 [Pholiota molesta]